MIIQPGGRFRVRRLHLFRTPGGYPFTELSVAHADRPVLYNSALRVKKAASLARLAVLKANGWEVDLYQGQL
jgi:hypothetical protein